MFKFLRVFHFAFLAILFAWAPLVAQSSEALAKAMDHMRAQDWPEAFAAVKPAGETGRAVVEWHYLRAGKGTLGEYETFLARYSDWPGLPYLRKRGEISLTNGFSAPRVLNYFGATSPETGTGALALAVALQQTGKNEHANEVLADAWRTMSLTSTEQKTFLDKYSAVLRSHHQERLDMLLWNGNAGQATAMLPYVSEGWRKLAQARMGLRKQAKGVDGLINAIPSNLANDAGLAYERFVWRARKGREADALALLNERSVSAASLGQPENWSRRRANLARSEMRAKRYKAAYEAASRHHLSGGSAFADLEWLSGYISLRFLNRPSDALKHFNAFQGAVDSPISLGRAGYWKGRAYEAMGEQQKALSAYQYGGRFQTGFYGQLAAEKAGMKMDPALLGKETFPSWQSSSFASSSVFDAGLMLVAAREGRLSARFMSHLAESLSREERGALAAWAIEDKNPFVALHIAKRAVQYGDTLHAAYFPMHPLAELPNLGVSPELALSIARRESEFNPRVTSSAGAQGMMQVMPGTAKLVSKRLGIPYLPALLTRDWEYNTKLGTNYLVGLNKEFGNNIILVSAGYNAGPGRPRRWLKERGDPRGNSERVVDWIEHIPFQETRNYTMRVSEALLPYRAQLKGKSQPLTLTQDLVER